jgi:hypothetical protein
MRAPEKKPQALRLGPSPLHKSRLASDHREKEGNPDTDKRKANLSIVSLYSIVFLTEINSFLKIFYSSGNDCPVLRQRSFGASFRKGNGWFPAAPETRNQRFFDKVQNFF